MRWNHLLQLSRAKAQTMAPTSHNGSPNNSTETDRRPRGVIGWWKPSRNTDMYTLMDTLDVDRVLEKLLAARALPAYQAALSELEIRQLCMVSREIFLQQPTLVELEAPVNVVGDIHGQYEDLLRHFDKCGYPPDANYLFLGDYVDRGQNSLETICLMMAYKIKYPNNFFLLRGNHESANINRIYGFYDECKRRYNIKVWKTFTDCFNCLPVAALIEGTIFCTHGGLSPELHNFEQIRCIPRPMEVPDEGLVCDLLWSDPEEDSVGWGENDRGVSYTFGGDIVEEFLEKHDCSLVVRAHQVVEDGYQFFQKRKLVTVFSAPNYCGEFDNAGAVLIISEDLTAGFSILPPSKNGTCSSTSPDCGVRGASALSGFFFTDPGR